MAAAYSFLNRFILPGPVCKSRAQMGRPLGVEIENGEPTSFADGNPQHSQSAFMIYIIQRNFASPWSREPLDARHALAVSILLADHFLSPQ